MNKEPNNQDHGERGIPDIETSMHKSAGMASWGWICCIFAPF